MNKTTLSRYDFTKDDKEFHSATIKLKRDMSIREIQTILREIYEQRGFNPKYIFFSTEDHKTILDEIAHHACCWYNTPASRFLNETTGELMFIVVSPRLESGKIIVSL